MDEGGDDLDDMEEGSDGGDAMDEDGSDIDESNPMAALIASARRAAEQYDRELQSGDDMDDDEDDEDDNEGAKDSKVTGGPFSSQAYNKVFRDVVQQADVVLYVLDARDPERTRSRDVERAVMAAASGGKRLILVLNKADLIPSSVLRGWLTFLRRYFPTLPLQASRPAPNAQTFRHGDMTMQSTSAALFRALKSFAASRNLKRAVSVGVIGFPNVGKSSVINALLSRMSAGGGRAQHNACPAGAEAGVTTSIRHVKIDSKLTLLDSPGIVFPSASTMAVGAGGGPKPKNKTEAQANLVLLNALPPKQIDDPVSAVSLLLKRMSTRPALLEKLLAVYDLPALLADFDSGDATKDFLVQVARKRGRLGRGGVPNVNAAAMAVITDWRDGRIQGWDEAPKLAVATSTSAASGASEAADAPMADQKEIVTEWAKEFKLEGLWGEDDAQDEAAEVEMQ
jgi:nuclear GTP-binding protein